MNNQEAEALTEKCLREMEENGLVYRFILRGKEVWDLTEKGKAMANRGSN